MPHPTEPRTRRGRHARRAPGRNVLAGVVAVALTALVLAVLLVPGGGTDDAAQPLSADGSASSSPGTVAESSAPVAEGGPATPKPKPTTEPPEEEPDGPPPGSPVEGEAAEYADRVVELVNEERAKAGCGALRVDAKVTEAAQFHADDMAARDYYEHDSPEGKSAGDRLDAAGYAWSGWAENIHKSPTDPEQAMRDWMDSPGHRDNILNCDYVHLGVGVNLASNGPWWVQVFGVPR